MVKDNRRKERSRQPKVTRSAAEERASGPVAKTAEEIAHELANVFMSISFSCAQLLAGIPENSPLRAPASAIAHDAAEGRSLSRKLGSLFYHAPRVEPVNLNRVVEEATARLRGLIPENIELGILLSENPVLVEADSEDVERIITNLVIDACDAMENVGTLTIRVEEFSEQGTASPDVPSVARNFGKLTVEHTGQAIRHQALTDILRSSTPAKGSSEETGMELAIVDSIVTRNGGYIEVENGDGSGTKISVLLPQPAAGTARQSESAQDKSA